MLASTPAFAEDCKLTHTDNNGKTFKFDLTRSVKGVGSIVSEKGHYSTNLTVRFGAPQQYWFQMCDLMSFSKQDQKAADSPASLCQNTYSGSTESVCGNKPFSSPTPSCQADAADMKTCGTTCAALQQIPSTAGNSQCHTIGQNFSTDLIANKHPELGVVVTIDHGDSTTSCKRQSLITVNCPADGKTVTYPVALGEDPAGSCEYEFNMTHPAACPLGGSAGSGGGCTWGCGYLIVFFLGFGLYFAGGFAYRYHQMGERGAAAVPNVEFWTEVPAYIKDGVLYSYECTKAGYQGLRGGGGGGEGGSYNTVQ